MFSLLKRLDWILIISAMLLVCLGLVSIYSSSSARGDLANFYKQAAFALVGFVLMIFLSFFDLRAFRENPYLILGVYFFCLLLLLGLLFFAPEIRGVKGWYKIGPFTIDPIEGTKLILIILLAKYFSKRHAEMYQVRHIILSGFYVFLPAFLAFAQPNMGSVIILIALWVGILIISGIKLRHFAFLVLCGCLVFGAAWGCFLKDYQKARLISFVAPTDPLGMSWSQNQAKIAVGSGGLFGKGILEGPQTQNGFLPEPHTDFIFAAIAEETGLLGCSLLFGLFSLLFWRIFKIISACESNFPRLFATGITMVLISHIFIHIGMNLGIMPIIGISLPLVSYGGSGLIATLASLGLLQSLKISQ